MRLYDLLATTSLLTAVTVSAATAATTVTKVEISSGFLNVAGTGTPGATFKVDNKGPFTVHPNGQFNVNIVYFPVDCIVAITGSELLAPLNRVVANCGARGIQPQGIWKSALAYKVNDVVLRDGTTWRARKAVPAGMTPGASGSGIYWQIFARKGVSGLAGVAGATGAQGATGAAGATGAQGATGAAGATGAQGSTGADGATGATGAQGAAGATGADGATGPQGAAGADGATGPQGAAGADGATGPQGAAGVDGATGSQGVAGADGATGSQGVAGVDGATGPQGAAGADGATGPQGAAGADGATGPQGAVGADGATGPQGAAGADGATGPQGVAGTNGTNGTNGTQGATGPQGAAGTNGTNGTNGAQGATGAAGPGAIGGGGLLTTGTVYVAAFTAQAETTEGNVSQPIQFAGSLTNVVISLNGTPNNGGGAQSYTFQVMKSGSATGTTCIITDNISTCTIAGPFSFLSTDTISVQSVGAGTPTVRTSRWTARYQ